MVQDGDSSQNPEPEMAVSGGRLVSVDRIHGADGGAG